MRPPTQLQAFASFWAQKMLQPFITPPPLSALTRFISIIQGDSNMTETDLFVNKPHCAAAVRPWESEATNSTLPLARVRGVRWRLTCASKCQLWLQKNQSRSYFHKLKMKLKVLHPADVAEIQKSVTRELKKVQKEEFSIGFQKLYDRLKACIYICQWNLFWINTRYVSFSG